jgi:NADPH2 dehydrogenase
MVGNIAVSDGHVPNNSTGVMSSSIKWAQLASAIRCSGSTPGIQLSATLPEYRGQTAFTSKKPNKEFSYYKKLFDKMRNKDWEQLSAKFSDAVDLAFEQGFDHIQIHAAHGYAFSMALDPIVNPAAVGIGPMSKLLEHLSKKFGNRSSLRVSWFTGLKHDIERQARILELWGPFASMIELDLSNGYYNIDKLLIYPPHKCGEAPYIQNAVSLAKIYPYAGFVVAGNIWNPYILEDCCPPNIHFAIARALIADPNHLISMREKTNMLCDDCGECHFFSTGKRNITCPKWYNEPNSADAKNRVAD